MMLMKLRLFLIKLLLGNKGLIANIEIDGRFLVERESRFLWIGGHDVWLNKNGLLLMNVNKKGDNDFRKFEFDKKRKYNWCESLSDIKGELIEKYGTQEIKDDWLILEKRFKTRAEKMNMTEEQYRKWYDENILGY